MVPRETEMILRALDDVRDDLRTQREETRQDFAIAFARLDQVSQLVARVDERTQHLTRPADDTPPSRRKRVGAAVRRHAPAAGVSAIVVALVELAPTIAKAIAGFVS